MRTGWAKYQGHRHKSRRLQAAAAALLRGCDCGGMFWEECADPGRRRRGIDSCCSYCRFLTGIRMRKL